MTCLARDSRDCSLASEKRLPQPLSLQVAPAGAEGERVGGWRASPAWVIPGSLEKAQWKDGLLGSSNTAGGGLRGGGPGPGLGKWSSSGARRGFHVPGETQEGGHWPCPLVKVDGDSGSSCGQVEPRSCFGRTRSISTRFQLNRGGQSSSSLGGG